MTDWPREEPRRSDDPELEAMLILNRPQAREAFVTGLDDDLEAGVAAIQTEDQRSGQAASTDSAATETWHPGTEEPKRSRGSRHQPEPGWLTPSQAGTAVATCASLGTLLMLIGLLAA